MGATDLTCNLRYNNTKKIPVVLHNRIDYNYCLIIKELAEKYKEHLE